MQNTVETEDGEMNKLSRAGRTSCAFAGAVLFAMAAWAKPAAAPFADGDRVVFLGDSITHGGWTVDFLQLYWAIRHPGADVTFINGGINGDHAWGGERRLPMDAVSNRATRVFAMFGMNDGDKSLYRTSPTDAVKERREKAIATYETNVTRLVRAAKAIRCDCTLVTPSPHDNGPESLREPVRRRDQGPGYNKLCLARLAQAVRRIAKDEKCGLVEVYSTLTAAIAANPDFAIVGADRTHPGQLGHLMITEEILKAVGEKGPFSDVRFDAAGRDFFTAAYLPAALPFPDLAECRGRASFRPFHPAFNVERLTVANLKDGVYAVKANGREIAVVTARQLAEGFDIACLETPNQEIVQKAFRDHVEPLHAAEVKRRDIATLFFRRPKEAARIPPAEIAALDEKIDACRAALRTLRPVAWKLEIAPKCTNRPTYSETGGEDTVKWATISRKTYKADLCVVGGGLAGVCAAVAAARNGAEVVLVQDRAMLGGNASSENRIGIAGALGSVNARGRIVENRETGLIEELGLRNLHLNPRWNWQVWDYVLWDFVTREGVKVLLNTSVNDLEMNGDGTAIRSVTGWDSISYTKYTVVAKYFADCSGDGILRLSGAKFMYGREPRAQYGESYAPEIGSDTVMGSTLVWTWAATGSEYVRFPGFSMAHPYLSLGRQDRVEPLSSAGRGHSCGSLEWGGMMNTVTSADYIRDELARYGMGMWEKMKNKGAGMRTIEPEFWASNPGKRESVRFVGDHILTQNDLLAEGRFPDVVCHGGWSMDDHFSEGFEGPRGQTTFNKCPHVYGIPYRSLYSVNIENLFFAGRDVSVTHMALSSTRVMATCAVMGQAVGTAAAVALRHGVTPRGVYEKHLAELQDTLQWQDQFVPWRPRKMTALTRRAKVSHPALTDGVERETVDCAEHGAWLADGEPCTLSFGAEEKLTGVRVVFDSDFTDLSNWRLRIVGGPQYRRLPAMLARNFRIELQEAQGTWRTVLSEKDNHARLYLRKLPWAMKGKALRLVIESNWSGNLLTGETKSHVYSFEAY